MRSSDSTKLKSLHANKKLANKENSPLFSHHGCFDGNKIAANLMGGTDSKR